MNIIAFIKYFEIKLVKNRAGKCSAILSAVALVNLTSFDSRL